MDADPGRVGQLPPRSGQPPHPTPPPKSTDPVIRAGPIIPADSARRGAASVAAGSRVAPPNTCRCHPGGGARAPRSAPSCPGSRPGWSRPGWVGGGRPAARQRVPGEKGRARRQGPRPPRPAEPEPPPATILRPGAIPDRPRVRPQTGRGPRTPNSCSPRQRVTEVVAQRQFAAAQLLPNLNLGTNYDLHRGAPPAVGWGHPERQPGRPVLPGSGRTAVAAGTVNIPGLNYNLNVGEAAYGFLAARQRARDGRGGRGRGPQRRPPASLPGVPRPAPRGLAGGPSPPATGRRRPRSPGSRTPTPGPGRAGRRTPSGRRSNCGGGTNELTRAEAETLTTSARLCQLLKPRPLHAAQADRRVGRPPPRWSRTPTPLPDLLAIALMQRPELAARRFEVRAALYELSLAKVLAVLPERHPRVQRRRVRRRGAT